MQFFETHVYVSYFLIIIIIMNAYGGELGMFAFRGLSEGSPEWKSSFAKVHKSKGKFPSVPEPPQGGNLVFEKLSFYLRALLDSLRGGSNKKKLFFSN